MRDVHGAASEALSSSAGRRIGRRLAAVALAALLLPLGAGALRAQTAGSVEPSAPEDAAAETAGAMGAGAGDTDLVPVSIGVLPFDRVGPPGASVPDAALRLADRLVTRGVTRVVGPGGYAEGAVFAPAPDQVQAWAAQTGVGALVAGRVTRIGQRISLDLRLRDSASGAVLSTHVAEAARPDELDAAVDRLAEQIVREARAQATRPPPVAARAARSPHPPPQSPSEPPSEGAASAIARAQADPGEGSGEPGASPPGETAETREVAVAEPSRGSAARSPEAEPAEPGFLGTGRSDEPLNIRSAELEAFEEGGERRFVFRRDVEVRQGDLRLTSRHLEAFYPKGSSQPDRLEASGDVVLVQEGREAYCDRATYLRSEGRVVCLGDDAVLVQDGDRVRGKEIEFDLDTERLVVRGGADVELQSDGESGGGS